MPYLCGFNSLSGFRDAFNKEFKILPVPDKVLKEFCKNINDAQKQLSKITMVSMERISNASRGHRATK